jgi:hypothetical protein
MSRLVVVLPLVPLSDDAAFSLADWPLHVTIAPTFTIEIDISEVISLLDSRVTWAGSLSVLAGHDEGFGRAGDIPVTVVAATEPLLELHDHLVDVLGSAGAIFDDPDFVGPGYRPHVTKTRHAFVTPAQTLVLQQAALVDMEPMGDDRLRRVAWTRALPNQTRSA